MLDKNYEAADVEPRIASLWDSAAAFVAGAGAKEGAEPYSIVIPPPNVTGSLHMGHALNNTLQDILIRFERMRGKNVLWQPGMDHAGIATQMVVERNLAAQGLPTRQEMGREAFIEKVWEWKEESGGQIFNQLKRLGASCDWSRERFTMDEGLSEAVIEVFVRLYHEKNEEGRGLIYRGKRLVNWDPHFETAISDLEVENIEVDGHMWHFKYPLAGGESYEYIEKDEDGNVTLREMRDYISIATTRPETMLGDGAVAVHPSDERYAPIIGKLCEIPVGPKAHRRLIPIITDEYPDKDFGSGAVKITGAHDFNDYQVAKRNNIPMYRLMDMKGAMRSDGAEYATEFAKAKAIVESGNLPSENEIDAINLVPEAYRGLDRFEARKAVIADIDAEGNMIRVEDKKVMQPFGDRSKVVIEPMLTDQWFVDAETLAKPALASVKEERTNFVPKNWENTYFNWMENIQPWCISRQLWWGHRIPAWFGPMFRQQVGSTEYFMGDHDGREIFVAKTEADAITQAKVYYEKVIPGVEVVIGKYAGSSSAADENGNMHISKIFIARDPDVLDTWFSSALWPFSTMGWPDENADALKTYFPTAVLSTAFDIIFFWVARMMMMSLHLMKDEDGKGIEPFHTVYIHPLVRDKDGQKMSKSKGNGIDPVEIIDEYGADALRFTLAAMAAQGRDVKLDPARIAGYRNFGTKLWNATRFAQMNGMAHDAAFTPDGAKLTLNRWALTELTKAQAEVTAQLEAYRFNDAANAAYKFVWNFVCDWYLELLKPVFNSDDEAAKAESRASIAYVMDAIYTMLHPFMPFMTEELFALTGERDGALLCHREWSSANFADEAAAAEINGLIDLVTGIRSVRSEMNIPAGAKAPLVIVGADADAKTRFAGQADALGKMARVTEVLFADDVPQGSAQIVLGGVTACLPLGQLIDIEAETARLDKAIGKASDDAAKIAKKLGNEGFVAKAPEAVVVAEKSKLAELEELLVQLNQAKARIESL